MSEQDHQHSRDQDDQRQGDHEADHYLAFAGLFFGQTEGYQPLPFSFFFPIGLRPPLSRQLIGQFLLPIDCQSFGPPLLEVFGTCADHGAGQVDF